MISEKSEVITKDTVPSDTGFTTLISLKDINIADVKAMCDVFTDFESLAFFVYEYYQNVKVYYSGQQVKPCHHNRLNVESPCVIRGTVDQGTISWKNTTLVGKIQGIKPDFLWPSKGNPSADRLSYIARLHVKLSNGTLDAEERDLAIKWLKQGSVSRSSDKSQTIYEVRHLCGCVCNQLDHLRVGLWTVNELDKHAHYFLRLSATLEQYKKGLEYFKSVPGVDKHIV